MRMLRVIIDTLIIQAMFKLRMINLIIISKMLINYLEETSISRKYSDKLVNKINLIIKSDL